MLTWGRGNSGQLGHGEVVKYALYPQPVTSLDAYFITHVSAGWSHSGFVSGSSSAALCLLSLSLIFCCLMEVAFCFVLSLGFTDGGCLFTCGDASFGQLGHGDYTSRTSPLKLSYFDNQCVARVACGMRHSIVLLKGIDLVDVFVWRTIFVIRELNSEALRIEEYLSLATTMMLLVGLISITVM